MRPWWQRDPARWRAERAALHTAGARYRVDARARAAGRLRLHLRWPAPAGSGLTGPLRLVAVYPDAYPFFPPAVTDIGHLPLPRHRHPTTGQLCLGHAEDWNVEHTLAAHLTEQLPKLLPAGTGDGSGPVAGPTEAAEPLTLYAPVAPCSVILVDGDWTVPADLNAGTLIARLVNHSPHLHTGAVTALVGAGKVLGQMPAPVAAAFPYPLAGPWLRLPAYDPTWSAEQLWTRATAVLPALPEPDVSVLSPEQQALWRRTAQRWQLFGLLVPDEIRAGQRGECWLFLLRHRPTGRHAWRTVLVQSAEAGPGDQGARRPQTAALAHRRALLVGAGALGGTIATELARAGLGDLDILDGDVIDPATLSRQVGTLDLAGLPKATALRAEIGLRCPHTRITPHPWTLGHVGSQPDRHAEAIGLVRAADLVIDATANQAASRYLAALARATATAFLHASATAGGHGGLVVRIRPGRTAGCWACLAHHRADGAVPAPPAAPDGAVHPARCAQPTFAGTGADLATIAEHAARLAIATLADNTGGGYPDFTGDLFIAALRDHHGHAVPATWHTADLPRHPACPR